jgi:hypothetical protein
MWGWGGAGRSQFLKRLIDKIKIGVAFPQNGNDCRLTNASRCSSCAR